MKKSFFALAALALSQAAILPTPAQQSQAEAMPPSVDAKERQAALLPLENWIKSQETGKAEYARAAFHKDALMTGIGRKGYMSVAIDDQWLSGFDGKASEDEPLSKRTVEMIDLTPTTGFARLRSVYPKMAFNDYMMLIKVDGEWKIAQKLFHIESAQAVATAADMKAALLPVENYVKALETGNIETARLAFHKGSRLVGTGRRGYFAMPIEEWMKGLTGTPAPDEPKRSRIIEMIDLTPTSGVARVKLVYPDVTFIDHMSLLKIDDEWKIVQKLSRVVQPAGN